MYVYRLFALLLLMPLVAACQTTSMATNTPPASTTMMTGAETSAPSGYISFCGRNPQECEGGATAPKTATLSPARWRELNDINTDINRSIRPVTDAALYRTVEYWTLPGRSGDCEDYVLLKRKELIKRGWPAESLLITVVRDQDLAGHAVLIAVTDKGDFVLDNQNNEILAWYKTPYRWQKRQSRVDPNVWVSLAGASAPTATAAAASANEAVASAGNPFDELNGEFDDIEYETSMLRTSYSK